MAEEESREVHEVLAQARSVSTGKWVTLGTGDEHGVRTTWWANHSTKGAFSDFRTVRRTTTTTVKTEVL